MIYAAVIAFACFALRLLSASGALAAAIVGGVTFEAGGIEWAAPLLAFFITSAFLTHLGKQHKLAAGIKSRPRNAGQVFAKGGPAVVCAAMYMLDGGDVWATAAIASLAAANADTWATELGTLFGKRFFLVTTLRPATRGTPGAVSLEGLLAGVLGAAIVAVFAPLMGIVNIYPVILIGFAAMLLDSVLGALIGRAGTLINAIAVTLAALAGYLFAA